jgi:hypothetical protein
VAEPEPFPRQDTEVLPQSLTSGAETPRKREVERTPLIAGVLFIVLAIVLMSGVDLPVGWFGDGGLVWVVLIGGGIALLVNELRRTRRRKT